MSRLTAVPALHFPVISSRVILSGAKDLARSEHLLNLVGSLAACAARDDVGRVLKNFTMSRLLRHSRRFGIIPCRLPFQSTPLQQRLDVGVAPHEILKQTQCISRTTATE